MGTRLLFVRLSLLVAIALLAAGQPAAADPALPTLSQNETLDNTTANITDSLTALDLEVREGYFQTWGTERCLPTFELMGTCYFNNPSAPYILPAVPYRDDEFVDPATKGVFGQTPEGYGTTFRFDPHEAILIFGYLPPPARYFGLYTYMYTHKGKYETDNETYDFFSSVGAESAFFHEIPLNPKRIGFMNSLSDSINNVMIKRQSGASWDAFRYFIITPDGHMERELRQALGELGVDDSEIFTERIPENVRLGLQKNADDFLSPLRYLMPVDGGGRTRPRISGGTARRSGCCACVTRPRATPRSRSPHGRSTAPRREPPIPRDTCATISQSWCIRSRRRGGSPAMTMLAPAGIAPSATSRARR